MDVNDTLHQDVSIHPDLIGDDVLSKYPATYIMGGSKDFMTIKSLCLAERIHNLGVDVK